MDWVDRQRAFDGTYRASATGNAKRDWIFSTPPLPRGRADYLESVLAVVGAQVCSGDVLGSNQLTHSDNLAFGAPWGLVTATATFGAVDPDGTERATAIHATAADGYVIQDLAAGTSKVRTNSVWLHRRIGTGIVQLYAPDGAANVNVTSQLLTTGFTRFQVPGAASTMRRFLVILRTSGDEVGVYGPQLEDGAVASTYTETVAVAGDSVSCCTEITGWTPIAKPSGHYAVLDFTLHEQ